MRIHYNFNPENPEVHIDKWVVVVIVKANKKHKVIYHSGLQYFYEEEDKNYFVETIKNRFSQINLEIYEVDTHEAHAPNPDIKKTNQSFYWCPYCQSYQKFKKSMGGYLQCPVCGISNNDFYVKKYNNLWTKNVKSRRQRKKKKEE